MFNLTDLQLIMPTTILDEMFMSKNNFIVTSFNDKNPLKDTLMML